MANFNTLTSDKSKQKALKYCAVGGWFGLHHYYVGNIGKGILYSCTLGVFLLGWIGDLISISVGSFKDNVGAPLRQ